MNEDIMKQNEYAADIIKETTLLVWRNALNMAQNLPPNPPPIVFDDLHSLKKQYPVDSIAYRTRQIFEGDENFEKGKNLALRICQEQLAQELVNNAFFYTIEPLYRTDRIHKPRYVVTVSCNMEFAKTKYISELEARVKELEETNKQLWSRVPQPTGWIQKLFRWIKS